MSWIPLTIFTAVMVGAYLLADHIDKLDESERQYLYHSRAKK
jgi:hypothetical protein